MAFILYFMNYLLKWAVCFCKLLSFVFNDIVCNLYFKIVLILLLLEAGDIEMNPGPDTINSSLSILHSNLYFKIVLIFLLLKSGDIEMNPGPNNINNSLSILHSNIRSIRNNLTI